METLSECVKACLIAAVVAILAAAVTGCTFNADLTLTLDVDAPIPAERAEVTP